MLATHKWASIEELEKARHDDLESALKELHSFEGVEECAILQTCNRVETYIVSLDGRQTLERYVAYKDIPPHVLRYHDHVQSLRHLLRLASGLESIIVGEDQILGQVKDAFCMAKALGTTGRILNTAFSKAINVGKRARAETKINKGAVSVGSAAVDLAEHILGSLDNRTIMVIGAGEMGTLVARALAHKNVHAVFVSSRTYEHAKSLAKELSGKAVRYDRKEKYIANSDVVISATAAPHTIINKELIEKVMGKRNDRKLLLIDIANPRDIEEDVAELPNVELHNIDDLKVISDINLKKRRAEISKVEKILGEELKLLEAHYKQQRADGVISMLYTQSEKIRLREKEKAINRLRSLGELDEAQMKIIDDLTDSLVHKVLAQPTKTLRNEAENGNERFLETTKKLFKLER